MDFANGNKSHSLEPDVLLPITDMKKIDRSHGENAQMVVDLSVSLRIPRMSGVEDFLPDQMPQLNQVLEKKPLSSWPFGDGDVRDADRCIEQFAPHSTAMTIHPRNHSRIFVLMNHACGDTATRLHYGSVNPETPKWQRIADRCMKQSHYHTLGTNS